jgi:anti-sigma regulatory factor (Ser/Thr protein kinase)
MTFSGGLSSVREARRFLSAVLREWGTEDYEFAAPQVLSELATNAALHARSSYTVEVRLEEGCLQIGVTDASPRLPRVRSYAADATTGRGLGLVAALSSDWGAATNGCGKTVWARVVPDGAALQSVDLGLDDLDLTSEGTPASGTSRGMARPTAGRHGVAWHLEAKAS